MDIQGKGEFVIMVKSTQIQITSNKSTLKPLGNSQNKTNPNYNANGPDKRTKIIDFSKVDTTKITIKVINGDENPVSDYKFTIQAFTRQESGGHNHTEDRPNGRFITDTDTPLNIIEGKTDSTGTYCCTYLCSGFGGVDSILVCGVTTKDTSRVTIPVRIEGLELLEDGDHFNLVGETTSHAVNHYGTSATLNKLEKLAEQAYMDSSYILQFNDMSLVDGGPFDCSNDYPWDTPHQTHREGTNVDMRTFSDDQKNRTLNIDYIKKLVTIKFNGKFKEEGKDSDNYHFHLTF
jgi:hypothetical protein